MTHQTAHMAVVERRPKGFGQRIGRVDDARDVSKDNFVIRFPFLDSEMLNINVTRTRCGATGVNHKDRGSIIFVERSGASLRIA